MTVSPARVINPEMLPAWPVVASRALNQNWPMSTPSNRNVPVPSVVTCTSGAAPTMLVAWNETAAALTGSPRPPITVPMTVPWPRKLSGTTACCALTSSRMSARARSPLRPIASSTYSPSCTNGKAYAPAWSVKTVARGVRMSADS